MDSTELGWLDVTWKEIYAGVLREVGKVRVAQKVFPTSVVEGDANQVLNEIIDFAGAALVPPKLDLSVQEGDTKPFVELYREFSLTTTQVRQETETKVGETLSRMSAKEIALAEDAYIFQVSDRGAARGVGGVIPVLNSPAIHADNWRVNSDFGLLGEANDPNADDGDPNRVSRPIDVPRTAAALAAGAAPGGVPPARAGRAAAAAGGAPAAAPSPLYGEESFKAVTSGIAKLVSKAQAPPYALFLPTDVYADTFIPPSTASLVTTADRIRPLVEGGFHTSGVLPAREGLLAALGGEPVKLFIGREATAEYVRKEGAKYFFRLVERVQYVVRDPRSLVLLRFAA
jgi:uncharacterized linocin/CFP29 family protein